ncbi:MAG TPA: hypothetical protein VLF20_01030 [Patescibacteria group bacterium]|nr:hypothetical protein [Patescibacteria group bacterium]
MNNNIQKTNSLIVLEHEIVEKTKEFLQKLSQKYKEAKVQVYSPVGVVVKSQDQQNAFAVAYEQDHFVIVAPNGTKESAKLYGNWEEAINNVRKFLKENCTNTAHSQFLLTEYRKVSL